MDLKCKKEWSCRMVRWVLFGVGGVQKKIGVELERRMKFVVGIEVLMERRPGQGQ